jgi:hypothetical protein
MLGSDFLWLGFVTLPCSHTVNPIPETPMPSTSSQRGERSVHKNPLDMPQDVGGIACPNPFHLMP